MSLFGPLTARVHPICSVSGSEWPRDDWEGENVEGNLAMAAEAVAMAGRLQGQTVEDGVKDLQGDNFSPLKAAGSSSRKGRTHQKKDLTKARATKKGFDEGVAPSTRDCEEEVKRGPRVGCDLKTMEEETRTD
eukprot:c1733_g1_i1 orf=104-502(+)